MDALCAAVETVDLPNCERPGDLFEATLVLYAVEKNKITFISGKTGVGKSTQVPQFLLERNVKQQKNVRIAVLQPRRLAARGLAKRVAQEMDTSLGGPKVGFRIGAEVQAEDNTMIVYITYGYFIERVMHDLEHLRTYTHIIIDEVHEWSSEVSFITLILREALSQQSDATQILDPNVKVLMMSATLQSSLINYFKQALPQVPISLVDDCEQDRFPISEFYLDEMIKLTEFSGVNVSLKLHRDALRRSVDKARKRYNVDERNGKHDNEDDKRESFVTAVDCFLSQMFAPSGQLYFLLIELIRIVAKRGEKVLIFLPGRKAILTMCELIDKEWHPKHTHAVNIKVLPLCRQEAKHEGDDLESRIKDLKLDERDCGVVLATNIAESSITIQDLRVVIDTGVHKIVVEGPKKLLMRFTSVASDKQRRGRTGRTCPGKCYFLHPQAWAYEENVDRSSEIGPFRLKDNFDNHPWIEKTASRLLLHAAQLCEPWGTSLEEMFARGVPPVRTIVTLRRWVHNLQDKGFLILRDKSTQLTFLGRLAISVPVDAQLTKLFYNCMVHNCVLNGVMLATVHVLQSSLIEYSFLSSKRWKFRKSEDFAEIGLCFDVMREFDDGHYSEPLMWRNIIVQILWEWYNYTLLHTRPCDRQANFDMALGNSSSVKANEGRRKTFIKTACNSRIFNKQAIAELFEEMVHFADSFITTVAPEFHIAIDYKGLETLVKPGNVEFVGPNAELPFLSKEFSRFKQDVELEDVVTGEKYTVAKGAILISLSSKNRSAPSVPIVQKRRSITMIIRLEKELWKERNGKMKPNTMILTVRADCVAIQKMARFRELVSAGYTYGNHPGPLLFHELFNEDPIATKDAICMSAEHVVFGQSKIWKIDSVDLEAPRKPKEIDPIKKELALLTKVVQTSNALEMQSTVRWEKMNPEFTGPFLYKYGTQTEMMAPKLMAVAAEPAELAQHVVGSMLKDIFGRNQLDFRVKLTKEGDVYITFAHEKMKRKVHPFSNERILLKTCPALVQKDKFRCPRGHLYGPEGAFVSHRLLCSICKSDKYAAKGHLCTNYGDPNNTSTDAPGQKCEYGILCVDCAAIPAIICRARKWPITVKPLSTEILMRANIGMSHYHLDNVVDPEIFDRNRRHEPASSNNPSPSEGPQYPPATNPMAFEWYFPDVIGGGSSGVETRKWKQLSLSPWNIASHWTECPEWVRVFHGNEIRREKPPYTVFIGVNTLDQIDGIPREQGRMMPMVTLIDPRREVSLLKLFALNRTLDFRAVVDRMGIVHGLEVSGKRFLVQHFPFRFITLCQDIRRTEFEIEVESPLNVKQRSNRIGMSLLPKIAKYFEPGAADERGDVKKSFREKLDDIDEFELPNNWKDELEDRWEEFAKKNGLETPVEGWNNLTRKGFMWCHCRGFSSVSSSHAPEGRKKDCEFRLVPLSGSRECICDVRVESVSLNRADPNFWTEDTIGNELRANRKIIEVVRHPRYRVKKNFNIKLIEGDIVHLLRQEYNRCHVVRVLHNEFFGRPFWIPSCTIGLSKIRDKPESHERRDIDAQSTNYGYSSPSDAYLSSSSSSDDASRPGTFRAYRGWEPTKEEIAEHYPDVATMHVLQRDRVRLLEGDAGDLNDLEKRTNRWLKGLIVGLYGQAREGYFPSYVLWP
eukprot:GEMP01000352.1.p1 GENE.GEMP01000352.1~~GEMP01000352.1.p1  ORF type:complete len:1650 (+),score=333.83 GEMP01000352.1:597-5546(+)